MKPEDLEAELKQGHVSQAALNVLIGAEVDNCATSIGWLEDKLRILGWTVARRPIHIDDPAARLTLTSTADFTAWCRATFPNACGVPMNERPGQQILK